MAATRSRVRCAGGDLVSGDFDAVVARVVGAAPRQSRALVAIDGVGGSGKSTFAARLTQRIDTRPVIVLHADDFFNPSRIRHAKGRQSPEGFWLDTYNYDAFTSWALTPLRPQSDGLYRSASYDPVGDRIVQPQPVRAHHNALVLVEGTFLHRDELIRFWDYSVYLDVSFRETARRMGQRDGLNPDPESGLMHRYVGAQRFYFSRARPWERASLVVDNTDFNNPRIIEPTAATAARC